MATALKVASAYGSSICIQKLIVYMNELYAINYALNAGDQGGELLKWNGSSAFSLAAGKIDPAINRIHTLLTFNDGIQNRIFGTGSSIGGSPSTALRCNILAYSGALVWEVAAQNAISVANIDTRGLAIFNNTLYANIRAGDSLNSWPKTIPGNFIAEIVANNYNGIYDMYAFDGKLYGITEYGGTNPGGDLIEFQETPTKQWNVVASTSTSGVPAFSGKKLFELNSKLYTIVSAATGIYIYEWDGISTWSIAASNLSFAGDVWDVTEFGGYIYIVGNDGCFRWNGVNSVLELIVAPAHTNENFRSITSMSNILYVGTEGISGYGGELYELDEPYPIAQPVPANTCTSSETANISLFGFNNPISNGLLATFGYLCFQGETGVLNDDYCTTARNKLIEFFKPITSINKYLCALTTQIQEYEFMLNDLLSLRALSTAYGKQLDGIGDIVGLDRAGFDDVEYRQALTFRIALNGSYGEPERLITAVKALTDASIVKLIEMYPARVSILTNGLTIGPTSVSQVQKIASAGVAIELLATYANPQLFAFETEGGIVDTDGLGFNEPDDASSGGMLVEKFS